MTRHQRLQKTLRSPARQTKQLRNRQTRKLRRAIRQAFAKVIEPQFPGGFHVTREPVETPEQKFRALQKAARRQRRERAS